MKRESDGADAKGDTPSAPPPRPDYGNSEDWDDASLWRARCQWLEANCLTRAEARRVQRLVVADMAEFLLRMADPRKTTVDYEAYVDEVVALRSGGGCGGGPHFFCL